MNSNNILDVVQGYLESKERYILTTYRFLNREIINLNYEIDSNALEVFLEYFKTRDEVKLKRLWKKGAIQRDIFLFSNLIYNFFYEAKKIKIEEYCKEKKFNSVILPILLSCFDELKELFIKITEIKLNSIYKDENFELFYEKEIKNFDYKDYYDAQGLIFFIILDGALFFENQVLGAKDCFFTYHTLFSTEVKLISETGTFLIIKIKSNFLKNMNITPTLKRKNFHIYSLEPIKFMIKNKNLDEDERFLLFRGIVYLLEYLKKEDFKILDETLLEYKRKILKLLSNLELLNEEEIVQKLLENLDVGLSKLYRIFEDLFSTTPNRYIQDLKLRETFKLLSDTDMRIDMMAARFGYSEKVFPQKFFEKTGYLPSTFRKMTKNGE